MPLIAPWRFCNASLTHLPHRDLRSGLTIALTKLRLDSQAGLVLVSIPSLVMASVELLCTADTVGLSGYPRRAQVWNGFYYMLMLCGMLCGKSTVYGSRVFLRVLVQVPATASELEHALFLASMIRPAPANASLNCCCPVACLASSHPSHVPWYWPR